jgi:hypothetical protein
MSVLEHVHEQQHEHEHEHVHVHVHLLYLYMFENRRDVTRYRICYSRTGVLLQQNLSD